MRDAWRHFAAEFIGTFALVFVGSGAIMTTRMSQSQAGLIEVALAHGLILAVMVSALMRVSGHFNPAVTLGFLATRRIEAMMAALYIIAQILGAIAAGYALKAGFPDASFVATRGGGQTIGLTIAADILAIGPLTGASMNPARSFGPAVASGVYEAQLLYWAAPITGGLIAALLYEFLFMRRGREPVDHGELKP